MNIILLTQEDFVSHGRASVRGRRQEHMMKVLGVKIGQSIKVGLVNGKIGVARIEVMDAEKIDLKVVLNQNPPLPWGSILVLALPRPLVLRRVLQAVTCMGIKEIHMIQTVRVEKSFWKSPVLSQESLQEACLLGLEQGVDTVLPRIIMHSRFRPFVESVLPAIAHGKNKLVAHPTTEQSVNEWISDPAIVVIGPEGGFVDSELLMFEEQGFSRYSLGQRVLKVETAVAVLLGRLSR